MKLHEHGFLLSLAKTKVKPVTKLAKIAEICLTCPSDCKAYVRMSRCPKRERMMGK